MADHRRVGFQAELERSARHTDDAFELDGFDFDRVATPAHSTSVSAAVGRPDRRLPDQARLEACGGRGSTTARPRGSATVGPAVRADGRLGLGFQWPSPQQPRGHRRRAPAHRRASLSGRRRRRHGLPARPERARSELRHRLWPRQHAAPAHQAVRPRPRRPFPPPPAGALAGGANSKDTPGFPTDPRLAGRPPQCCYLDEPTSETTNDICIRWSAPLAYVAAYLGSP